MNDSILISVKKLLGYGADSTPFDADFIIDINTIFGILCQLGVGPTEGFSITDETDIWSSFSTDKRLIPMVKSYIVLRVRLLFDTPTSSVVTELLTNQYKELEFRMRVLTETVEEE